MGILKRTRDKLEVYANNSDMMNQISAQGQTRFVNDVMREENVDRETALRWCLGIDPSHPEISLGYKLADPVWSTGCFNQPGRRARAQARENFKKQLNAEELALFEEYCEGRAAGKVRRDMKAEIKKQKKQHSVDVSEFEGEDDNDE